MITDGDFQLLATGTQGAGGTAAPPDGVSAGDRPRGGRSGTADGRHEPAEGHDVADANTAAGRHNVAGGHDVAGGRFGGAEGRHRGLGRRRDAADRLADVVMEAERLDPIHPESVEAVRPEALDDLRVARVALSRLVEPGHRQLGELIRSAGAVEALDMLCSGEVPGALKSAARARLESGDPREVAALDLETGKRLGARLVIPEDAEWPAALADLTAISTGDDADTDPPLCLWVRGYHRLDEAVAKSVSIVGARAATAYGTHVSSELGYGVADRGWTVVSGGAYGIDGSAHRGALAAGGVTMAVLACGVDTAYPAGNANLFERIAADGLLVSEWPPGATPQRHRFLIRNRVIAALSAGTVVVEAAARSGARMTARRATELGRLVMAVPGPVTSAMSVGSHELVRQFGARLVGSSEHVLEEVGRIGEALAGGSPGRAAGSEPVHEQLGPRAARILDAVPTHRPASPERIAASAGLAARDVRRALPSLVMLGLAEEVDHAFRLTASARAALATRPPVLAPDLR